jgi:acyloxyacyl hydrolase
MGLAVLGDSIAAHFRLPDEWLDATQINEEVFKHIIFIIENEIDWPHLSAMTGYFTYCKIIIKTLKKFYLIS